MTAPRLLEDIRNQPSSFRQTAAFLPRSGVAGLAEAIRRAPGVLLTGMGSSLYAGMILGHSLDRLGIPNRVIETAELLHFPYRLRRDELVVLISRSGETVESLELLSLLKDRNAQFAGVTSVAESTLARACERRMVVSHLPDEIVAVQSYTATVLALQGLAALLAGGPADAFLDQAEAIAAATGQWLPELEARASEWKSFLENAACLYVLGRGTSLASALEAGLLFHEVSKQPASAVSAPNFRHGPVEISGPQTRVVLFANQSATRSLDLALATDLRHFGAEVRVIETPGDPVWAEVIETIPLQLAALWLAQWRGIPLGQFRFASQVTRAEDRFTSP